MSQISLERPLRGCRLPRATFGRILAAPASLQRLRRNRTAEPGVSAFL